MQQNKQQGSHGKADLHIHTIFSDGLMTPEVLVEYVVAKTDLSVIAITDHDTIAGALVAQAFCQRFHQDFGQLEIIVGQEVTSADGDILALFINQEIDPGLSAAETIDAIHAAGGLAIAAHPCAVMTSWLGMDGMKGVGRKMHTLPLDAVETRNATPTEFATNLITANMNQRGPRHAVTGGSDTHYLTTVGSTFTRFPGHTAADLRKAIEQKQTQAGGHVYSPFLIFKVIHDLLSRRLPIRHMASEHAAEWPLA
jgi:hypothetical protein